MAILEQQVLNHVRSKPLVVKEQFEQWFEASADVLRAVEIPVNWDRTGFDGRTSHEKTNEYWARLRQGFSQIDYSRLSIKDHRKLHRLLNRKLPKLLQRYMQKTITKGHEKGYFYLKDGLRYENALWDAQGITKRQKLEVHQQRYQSALQLAQAKTKTAAIPAIAVKPVTETKAHFAFVEQLSRFDRGLGTSVHSLLNDWNAAFAKAAGVEQRYRLEQIVNELLPELARVLPGVSEASKAEAVALISEQLKMLHAQVRAVLEQHEGDAMDALRAQTAFVRELTNRSHLALEVNQEA